MRQTDQAVPGELRVSAPLIVSDGFSDMLAGFAKRYPEVRLHVHLTSQHVDLRRAGYDVAIRASSELEPGLVARSLVALSSSPSTARSRQRGAALVGHCTSRSRHCLLPLMLAKPHLDDGTLVQVLSGEVGAEARLSVVYLEREFVPPQLRAFIDAVVAWSNAEGARAVPEREMRAAKNPTPLEKSRPRSGQKSRD